MRFKDWLCEDVELDSQQFKQWFAGSVLVTPNGAPLVLYHGTKNRPFQQFQYRKSKRFILFSEFEVESKGFFFTENYKDAKGYGPNVVACYVKMVNPFLDPRKFPHMGVDRLPYKKEMELMKILAPLIKWEKFVSNRTGKKEREPYIDLGVGRHYLRDRTNHFAHQWIYNAVGHGGLVWDVLDVPGSIQKLKTMGYDGTFVNEPEDQAGRSIFVPDGNQIVIDQWNPTWHDPDEDYD